LATKKKTQKIFNYVNLGTFIIIVLLYIFPLGWVEISSEEYKNITESQNNTLFLSGYENSPIALFEFDQNESEYLLSNSIKWTGLQDRPIVCPLEEIVWIGMNNGHLTIYDEHSEILEEISVFDSADNIKCRAGNNSTIIFWNRSNLVVLDAQSMGLLYNEKIDIPQKIDEIYQSASGELWITTINDRYIYRLNFSNGIIDTLKVPYEISLYFEIYYIDSLDEFVIKNSGSKDIYIGKVTNAGEFSVEKFFNRGEFPDSKRINNIAYYQEKEIYVFIMTDRVFAFEDFELRELRFPKRIYPSIIYSGIINSRGDIIILTKNGVFKYSLK